MGGRGKIKVHSKTPIIFFLEQPSWRTVEKNLSVIIKYPPYLFLCAILSVNQIRRVFGDNLGIILLISHYNICYGYSLESPQWGDSNEYSLESPQWGDSNEYPQHVFLRRTDENYPWIIIKYPSYLFFCAILCRWWRLHKSLPCLDDVVRAWWSES